MWCRGELLFRANSFFNLEDSKPVSFHIVDGRPVYLRPNNMMFKLERAEFIIKKAKIKNEHKLFGNGIVKLSHNWKQYKNTSSFLWTKWFVGWSVENLTVTQMYANYTEVNETFK